MNSDLPRPRNPSRGRHEPAGVEQHLCSNGCLACSTRTSLTCSSTSTDLSLPIDPHGTSCSSTVARGMYRDSQGLCSRLADLFNNHGENVVLARQPLELEPT